MTKILNKLKGATFKIPTVNDCMHRSYKGMHTAYFVFLAIEEHGYLSMIGGGMVFFSIADFFLHFEEGDD